MPIAGLTQFDPSTFFQAPAPSAQGVQRLDTNVSAISTASDLTGRLSVVTAEGDKITLSADLEARFQAASYQGHAESNGKTVDVRAQGAAFSLSQQYGVTVEGDLNEQEVHDLEGLFRKVSNIFSKFFNGQDEAALAKTVSLAEQFGQASSLSSLDLSVDVERSVTMLASQMVSAVTGSFPNSTATPGGASATAAVIPQPSTGTTAPTPPSTASPDGARLLAPAQDAHPTASLVRQILDALEQSRLDVEKTKKYLPDFLKKLREDLGKDAGGERDAESAEQADPVAAPPSPTILNGSMLVAYQAARQTTFSFSLRT
ncbi:MAG: hypothetical protein RI101_00615 [Nitrospira sp.]|jgi:hypothetical protein|nr:hypothetical protein [Nitrospira sp.]